MNKQLIKQAFQLGYQSGIDAFLKQSQSEENVVQQAAAEGAPDTPVKSENAAGFIQKLKDLLGKAWEGTANFGKSVGSDLQGLSGDVWNGAKALPGKAWESLKKHPYAYSALGGTAAAATLATMTIARARRNRRRQQLREELARLEAEASMSRPRGRR